MSVKNAAEEEKQIYFSISYNNRDHSVLKDGSDELVRLISYLGKQKIPYTSSMIVGSVVTAGIPVSSNVHLPSDYVMMLGNGFRQHLPHTGIGHEISVYLSSIRITRDKIKYVYDHVFPSDTRKAFWACDRYQVLCPPSSYLSEFIRDDWFVNDNYHVELKSYSMSIVHKYCDNLYTYANRIGAQLLCADSKTFVVNKPVVISDSMLSIKELVELSRMYLVWKRPLTIKHRLLYLHASDPRKMVRCKNAYVINLRCISVFHMFELVLGSENVFVHKSVNMSEDILIALAITKANITSDNRRYEYIFNQ